MRRIIGIVAALALLFAAGGAAAAGSKALAGIVKRGEIRVGMSGNQPPLNTLSKSGEVIGLEVDLARLLAASMDVEAKIVQKPFGELLPALRKGDLDLVISGVTITPQRNLEVAFAGPYFISGKSVLTRASTLESLDQTAEIDSASNTVTALEGSTSQQFVESLLPQAKLITTKDYDEGVALVTQGKAAAMIADFPICLLSVLRHPEAKLATLATPFSIEPVGIALPPDDVLFLNLVQNYLNAVQGAGVMEKLQKKWFEDGSWLSELP